MEDVFTVALKQTLRRKAFEHAALAVGTTQDQLREVLSKAITEGQGIPEIARGIRDAFDFNSKVRSIRIARTETTGVINDGTSQALWSEGYREKTWSTVIDGRERPDHAAADGQTVAIDVPFSIGGAAGMYPGDAMLPIGQIANCRCTLVGAGIPDERRRQIGERFLRTHNSLEHKFVLSLRKGFLAQRDRILSRLNP